MHIYEKIFKIEVFNLDKYKCEYEYIFNFRCEKYVILGNKIQLYVFEKIENSIINNFPNSDNEIEFKLILKNKKEEVLLFYSIYPNRLDFSSSENLIFYAEDELFCSEFTQEMLIFLYQDKKIEKYWYKLSKEGKKYYLELSYYHTLTKNICYTQNNIIIDGIYIHCKQDFFCYLGEEINRIFGYFGRDFDGLHDALTGGLNDLDYPINIKWINFNISEKNFDDKKDLSILVDILQNDTKLTLVLGKESTWRKAKINLIHLMRNQKFEI